MANPPCDNGFRLGVLAALDQRIAVRFHIGGMDAANTADYAIVDEKAASPSPKSPRTE